MEGIPPNAGAGLPRIVLAERQAPMRRALRRLLGESRFEWTEVERADDLLQLARAWSADLLILEDRLLDLAPDRAMTQLRAMGCSAPVIVMSSRTAPLRPGPSLAEPGQLMIIDRLEISARLVQGARALLPDGVDWDSTA